MVDKAPAEFKLDDEETDAELATLVAEPEKKAGPKFRGRQKTEPSGEKASSRKKKIPGPVATPRATPLETRIRASLSGMELIVRVAFSDEVCGNAIAAGAPQLAKSLDDLAKQDPRVRRALEMAMTGGAWGEVLAASLTIVLPVLAHHGILGREKGRHEFSGIPGEPSEGEDEGAVSVILDTNGQPQVVSSGSSPDVG